MRFFINSFNKLMLKADNFIVIGFFYDSIKNFVSVRND